jgi:hypothetical protein
VGDVMSAAADRQNEHGDEEQRENEVFEHQLAPSVSGSLAAADFGCKA